MGVAVATCYVYLRVFDVRVGNNGSYRPKSLAAGVTSLILKAVA